MSGTQPASATTTQPPAAVIANGKRAHRAKPQAAEPGATGQAAPVAKKRTLSPSQIAARTANLAKGREARARANAQATAATSRPAAMLQSPVMQDLLGMLPDPGGSKWSQQQAVMWMEACAANIRLIYGFAGSITVTGTPAT